LRVRLTASGGTRNPHVPRTYTAVPAFRRPPSATRSLRFSETPLLVSAGQMVRLHSAHRNAQGRTTVDNLRLILILVGLLVLALIVLLHRPEGESKRNHARWRAARREPTLGGADGDHENRREQRAATSAANGDSAASVSAGEPRNPSPWPAAEQARSESGHLAGETSAVHEAPDKIVYLYICRRG